jgi:UPF0755 protein
MKKIIATTLMLTFLSLSAALGLVYYMLYEQNYEGPVAEFEIRSGESFSSINARLSHKGYIKSARLFHRYCQHNKLIRKFKPGIYDIPTGATVLDVVDILMKGTEKRIIVTIPEGKNMFEIGDILQSKGLTTRKEFLETARNQNILKKFAIPRPSLEGYLYPDTYYFNEGSSTRQIVETMVRTFKSRTKSLEFTHPKLSKHELVILASMVEKETGASWERPTIAGVFYNRLRKGMRLQSDPTTIYGIYETYNGNLRKRHLLEKTPYNTYKIPGLPKGPIANPGIEAIKSVLNPKIHKFLYFVSVNDGRHAFSETYKKHLEYVDKYQKTRKNRVGKSWRQLNKK